MATKIKNRPLKKITSEQRDRILRAEAGMNDIPEVRKRPIKKRNKLKPK